MLVMFAIGGTLIYLAIARRMEPALLLPIGFGAILVNLPFSGAVSHLVEGAVHEGPLSLLFEVGFGTELFPLLLFIGLGAMIDFGPLLTNPKLMLFGAAAQLGIFLTLLLAATIGHFFPGTFTIQDAASIAIIGSADGPTTIFLANYYDTRFLGAIIIAAYSYMALVPIIQPPVIRALTTPEERRIRMTYSTSEVSRITRILFPIMVTVIAGLIAPRSVALIGFLMFGNLLRECGVLDNLSETAQHSLVNIITILLGITIAVRMQAAEFLTVQTLLILGLGLLAFVFDTAGGVLFAKLINVFAKTKINPMIGASGVSAFPMSARVVHKMGLAEDNQNFLLMHAVGVNVSGTIASVIVAGLIMGMIAH